MTSISREIVAAGCRLAEAERDPESGNKYNWAWEQASIAVEAFAEQHPEVVMSYSTWLDLKEQIERAMMDLEPMERET